MKLFFLVSITLVATVSFVWALKKAKFNELSQFGQFLQGLAAIIAICIAISNGEEILNKINALTETVGRVEKVLERVDDNVSKFTAPKTIFDTPPETESEDSKRDALEKKKQFWTSKIEEIESNPLHSYMIADKANLINRLSNAKNSDEAAIALEGGIKFKRDSTSASTKNAKVNKTPINGSILFSISK